MTNPLRKRWAAHIGTYAALTALISGITGCSASGERCADLYSSAIGAVEGVASVDVDCNLQFGGGWQRIDVHLATNSSEDARVIGETVLKAVASEPEMEPQWTTPRAYYLEDGTQVTIVGELGFNGVPQVRDVREQYGIEP